VPAIQKAKTAAIDSLGRGIDLLEILAEHDSVKLADLPQLLGTSRATAFRALKTLQARGYVEHVPAESSYRLGPAALLLAARSRTSSFVRAAAPAMRDIADKTGETVNLALFRGGTLSYAEIVEGRHPLRMSGDIGQRVPLHSTALGKAILAALPEERQLELVGPDPYEAFTPNTITTWKKLRPELEETARRGFALDHEEMDSGAACVSAAILGQGDYPVGGLSASGWAPRMSDRERARIGKLIADWCSRITVQLGFASEDGGAARRNRAAG
jgi:IclR family acetate operon transcriptional repressor